MARSLSITYQCSRARFSGGYEAGYRQTVAGDENLVPLGNLGPAARIDAFSPRRRQLQSCRRALLIRDQLEQRVAMRLVFGLRSIDHVFHEAGNARSPVIVVVLPHESFGVQQRKHIGRVSGMPGKQFGQRRVRHRAAALAERQCHVAGQRQGVRFAEFLMTFPIVLPPGNDRDLDGCVDVLGADVTERRLLSRHPRRPHHRAEGNTDSRPLLVRVRRPRGDRLQAGVKEGPSQNGVASPSGNKPTASFSPLLQNVARLAASVSSSPGVPARIAATGRC